MPIILQNNPLLSARIAMISNHSDPNTDYSPSYDQDVLEDLGAKLIVHNDDGGFTEAAQHIMKGDGLYMVHPARSK